MNRQIKFKLWLPHEKRMTYSFDVTELPDKTQINDGVIYLQFTGILDKNKKECYHKDLLKGYGKLWVIEWQNEEARFLLLPSTGNSDSWKFMDECSRMKVIGNVYEDVAQ